MGEIKDKTRGLGNEAMGNVKQGVGKMIGNEQMQAEGKAQELKGEAQQAKGKVKGKVNDAL